MRRTGGPGFYRFAVHGANHRVTWQAADNGINAAALSGDDNAAVRAQLHYFNTQWSPHSRQVAASDNATPVKGHPGQCTDHEDAAPARQLTEPQQRHVAATYLGAFFRRYLLGDTGQDKVLTGARHPDAAITEVDVTTAAP
ncbi:hypothetical protein [Streptomyces axinellae]|uniref:Uncharacterized protein n=1 Tax=Streptomyces axinellae TaxID=552788 RepID=A0ABN3PT62_9ACTN